jgi:hypothetical protein
MAEMVHNPVVMRKTAIVIAIKVKKLGFGEFSKKWK